MVVAVIFRSVVVFTCRVGVGLEAGVGSIIRGGLEWVADLVDLGYCVGRATCNPGFSAKRAHLT